MSRTQMGVHMEFRILGPLEALAGERSVPLGGPRQRAVLAMLLINVDRVVSIDRLGVAIWGHEPPATARNQIAICVSGLRREFAAAGVHHDFIVTAPSGYLLRLGDHVLDLKQVEETLRRARAARTESGPEEASRLFAEALDHWRGEPLAGVDAEVIRSEAQRLREWRLAILEEYFEVELEQARDYQIVGELTALVDQFPLRERLRALLMLAQSRAGRRAEALATYQEGYRLSVERLGLEPGGELVSLHEAILRGQTGPRQSWLPADQEAVAPAPTTVPAQLPPDVSGFVGRAKELDTLNWLLAERPRDGRPFIAVITGMGGVGKSGLAVHWSHLVSARFPDGQLFVDLNGYSEAGPPLAPFDVLDHLLRALNVPRNQPLSTLEERAAMFRSALAGRQVLLVLDNARDSSQVRPLLPGATGCAVVVTSRDQLVGLITLEGATQIRLGVLEPEEGMGVVAGIAGEQRVNEDVDGARRLSELCGGLPLALRVAAARLAIRPNWTSADLVTRLTDESRRLDELSHSEVDVRAKLTLSYRDLPADLARMFRRLALPDVPEFSPWLGAALMEVPVERAQDLVEELVDAQLLEVGQPRLPGQPRYRFHDLVRLYARERAMTEESRQEREAALRRALGCWLSLTEAAHARLLGGDFAVLHGAAERYRLPDDVLDRLLADPLEWFEAERQPLLSAIGQAAAADLADLCWDLVMTSATFFESRSYFDDWRGTHELALAVARRIGDARGEAAMIYGLGSLELFRQRYDEAEPLLAQAMRTFEEQGERHGHALALRNLAFLDRMAGHFDLALERYAEAAQALRACGDRAAEAHVLASTAQVRMDREEYAAAEPLLRVALTAFEEIGHQRGLAQALHRFGEVLLHTQRIDEARRALEKALDTVQRLRDVVGESYVMRALGETYARQGRTEKAEKALLTARDIAYRIREQFVVGSASLALGNLYFGIGDTTLARNNLTLAAKVFEELGTRVWHARALEALAVNEALLRNDQGAHELWALATAILSAEAG